MEEEPISETKNTDDGVFFSSSVDTSRPFSSVKEAVAIFGERLLSVSASASGGDYSPKPSSLISAPADTTTTTSPQRDPSWRLSSPMKPMKRSSSSSEEETKEEGVVVIDTLRKLEAELEKTKAELKVLKERGSETEVALATLNAELHKNMSKLAQAEAVAAGKAAAATKTVRFEINQGGVDDDDAINSNNNNNKEQENNNNKKKKKKKEYITRRMDDSKTLAHILSLGENDHLFGAGNGNYHNHNNLHHKIISKSRTSKHKPIIPLVGDFLFFKRKSPSPTNHHI